MKNDLTVKQARQDSSRELTQSQDELELLSQRIEVLEQRLSILQSLLQPACRSGRSRAAAASAARDQTTVESGNHRAFSRIEVVQ